MQKNQNTNKLEFNKDTSEENLLIKIFKLWPHTSPDVIKHNKLHKIK